MHRTSPPNTVLAYVGAVEQFSDFLIAEGLPTDVAKTKGQHVGAFIAWMLDATKPDGSKRWKLATANNRFRGCQRTFNWLVEEGEITASPMARMKPSRIPEQPPEVIREDDLNRMSMPRHERPASADRARPPGGNIAPVFEAQAVPSRREASTGFGGHQPWLR